VVDPACDLGKQGWRGARRSAGRDLLVSSAHTFAELASAIDRAFARWDLSHWHEFRLLDGRRIVMEDADEFEQIVLAHNLGERAYSLSSIGLSQATRSSTFSTWATTGSTVALFCVSTSIRKRRRASSRRRSCPFSAGERFRTSTDVCLQTTIRTSNEM